MFMSNITYVEFNFKGVLQSEHDRIKKQNNLY